MLTLLTTVDLVTVRFVYEDREEGMFQGNFTVFLLYKNFFLFLCFLFWSGPLFFISDVDWSINLLWDLLVDVYSDLTTNLFRPSVVCA